MAAAKRAFKKTFCSTAGEMFFRDPAHGALEKSDLCPFGQAPSWKVLRSKELWRHSNGIKRQSTKTWQSGNSSPNSACD